MSQNMDACTGVLNLSIYSLILKKTCIIKN